jgi:hypothetical protein
MSGPQAELIPALILRPHKRTHAQDRSQHFAFPRDGARPRGGNHTSAFEPTEPRRQGCKWGKVKLWRVMI